jgi:ADP-ribose pyrophosphatase YjhB (NUDIX family)
MNLKITSRGIVLHEGKLLCVRLKPYRDPSRSTANDFWCVPGGGLEGDESIIACTEREMIEETGVKPVIGNLLYVQQFTDGETKFVEFFFHITNSQDYLHIDLSKTTHGEEEIEEIGFVEPRSAYILPAFLCSEDVAAQIQGGLPTKVF